jgi:hypothetical protein
MVFEHLLIPRGKQSSYKVFSQYRRRILRLHFEHAVGKSDCSQSMWKGITRGLAKVDDQLTDYFPSCDQLTDKVLKFILATKVMCRLQAQSCV